MRIDRLPKAFVAVLQEKARDFLPDEEFNKTLDEVVAMHTNYFKDVKTDNFMPMVVMYSGNDNGKKEREKVILMLAIEEFKDERFKAMWEAGRKIAYEMPDFNLWMAFFTSEAWVKQFNTDEKRDLTLRASEYEDKTEALVTQGLTLDQRVNGTLQNITRDDNKNIILGEEKHMYCGKDITMEAELFQYFFGGHASGVEELKLEKLKKAGK